MAWAKAIKIKDGYTPRGIVAITQHPTGSSYLDIVTWYVGIDSEDDQRKVFVRLRNSTEVDITFTMEFMVLYIRD